MIERMRANCAPARLGEYLTTATNPLGSGNPSAAESTPTQNCRTSTCTPAQLVIYDRWQWEQTLNGEAEKIGTANTGGLVFPTACVDGPAGGGDGTYTLTVVWRGTVGIPDANTGVTPAATPAGCGRDVQVGVAFIYGEDVNGDGVAEDNDRFRRSVSIPAYITARQSGT
jgi:type IV pilus assembly protein PilV